jgi:hypothetical protein
MTTYTTKSAGKLMFANPQDERRDADGLVTLFGGYAEVNLTQQELEEYEFTSGNIIDSDQIRDGLVADLMEFLFDNELLEGEG